MTNFLLESPLRLRLLAHDLQKFAENNATIFLRSLSSQSTNNGAVHSKDSAPAAAKRTHLRPTADPGSVRALFASYGFAPSDAESIFSRCPGLLAADPDRTLKPKLQFLSQNGVSGQLLVLVISRDPHILRRSLHKQIVPCIDFLTNFFGSTDGIVSLFSANRRTWIFHQFSESCAPNAQRLRAHGVPDFNIAKLIRAQPGIFSRDAGEFIEIVERAKEAGFNPSSLMFVYGLCALNMRREKWVSKLQVFRSFGWSEEQFRLLFLKQPKVMNSSVEQLKRGLDLCMNKFNWTPEEICKNATVLSLSFEKRVIPRWSILQHLISKGFIKKTSVGNAFIVAEDKFVVKFVMKYLSKDPHLLEMYQKKMPTL